MPYLQRRVPVTLLCVVLISVSFALLASASASASASAALVAAVPLTQSVRVRASESATATADGHEWSSPTKPLHVGAIRVTYTGWVEVDIHAHGYETLRNLKVYVRHWPSNETRIAHINVLPAGEHVTVTLPHPPFPLSFPCNLFGVVVQKHSGHTGGGYRRRLSALAKIEKIAAIAAHEVVHASTDAVPAKFVGHDGHDGHEFATYTRALFRVCQLSSTHTQPAVRQTTCSPQCAHDHVHSEWFHCCARSLSKECAVACCKAEQRYVEVPQCCVVQRNRSSVVDYADHFRSVSYRNSNGETDWRELPWQEKPAFLPFIKLMGDDNPRTGRIGVSEEKDALEMQCGGADGCTAGCVFGVPMYVHRHLRREWSIEDDNEPAKTTSTLYYEETYNLLVELYWKFSSTHRIILALSDNDRLISQAGDEIV